MFGSIYNGRKVFITGHTGFKGAWLAAWLTALGAEVTGYALDPPTRPSLYDSIGLTQYVKDIRGDVRNASALRHAVEGHAPEIIFHLAAQALVRQSYAEPALTFETNILGTVNICEALRSCPSVRAAVIITSDKCYRNDEWIYGYRETDRLGGYDPYSASKGCAELVAHSYFESYFGSGPACATARAGNVIGGGDWALDRIVPDCARAWRSGKPAQIRNPRATRPWQHVLEPLSGYLWLGARLLNNDIGRTDFAPQGQAYNFGPPADAVYPVSEVAASLARHWPGFSAQMDNSAQSDIRECGLLKLCCDKALAELGWKACLDFEETVRYTAEWYSRFHAGATSAEMRDYTQGQIAAYSTQAQARGLIWASA